MGWGEEDQSERPKAAKKNRKEAKQQRAKLIDERTKATSPLKKEIEQLEAAIMETEEQIGRDQKLLAAASSSGDNGKITDLSKQITRAKEEVEKTFERLAITQTKLDELLESYEKKLGELE